MEWLGLVVWVLVLMVASPVALAAVTAPPLGLLPPTAIGGLAACVLYLATGGSAWLAWLSAGLALAAATLTVAGAAMLISDAPDAGRGRQQIDEHAATLAGVAIPLLLTTAFVMVLAAVGVTTVS